MRTMASLQIRSQQVLAQQSGEPLKSAEKVANVELYTGTFDTCVQQCRHITPASELGCQA